MSKGASGGLGAAFVEHEMKDIAQRLATDILLSRRAFSSVEYRDQTGGFFMCMLHSNCISLEKGEKKDQAKNYKFWMTPLFVSQCRLLMSSPDCIYNTHI